MKILYLGDLSGTSLHRIGALRRLGFDVEAIDPRACFGHSKIAEHWVWRAGAVGMEGFVRRYVLSRLQHALYDVVMVNHGDLVGPSLVRALRDRSRAILHNNLDNPFVTRDRRRWYLHLKSMDLYDLHGTPRVSTAEEGIRRGLKMYRYFQTADEVVHRPRPFSPADQNRFGADVAFIGTWFPERGPFVARLLEAGVAVRIFGPRWDRAPEFEQLKYAMIIPEQLGDETYVRAIQYARIALGFVSFANQDLHTTRSAEVPAIGTLLCAQRTSEHLEMYRDGEEAVFWDDMDECAAQCLALLAAPERLASIAAAGAARQAASPRWNEQIMATLVETALENATRL